MVNPQLLDYTRQQIAAGVSKEEISKSLIASGWQVSDINEAFASFASPASPPLPPRPNQTTNLPVQKESFWGKKKVKFIVGLLIVGLIYIGITYFFANPKKIGGFPPSAQMPALNWPDGNLVNEKGSLSLKNGTLTLTDLNTSKEYKIVGSETSISLQYLAATTTTALEIHNAALGDGFAVWVVVSEYYPTNASNQGRRGVPQVFDLWGFDFSTGKESILLEDFDNNHNGNPPKLAISGRNVAIFTFDSKIHVVNFDTKEITEIDTTTNVANGYQSFPFGNLIFISESLVFPVMKETASGGSMYALIEYNLSTKSFRTLHETRPYVNISNVVSNPNVREIYWIENRPGFGDVRDYYKMRI